MSNESVNTRAEARYLGDGASLNNINLYEYSGGYFPCVSLENDSSGNPVVVDVFEVTQDNLQDHYDVLEGYPGFYDRTKIPVKMYNDDVVECWIYHIAGEQEVLVEHGDWVKHQKDRGEDNLFINFTS